MNKILMVEQEESTLKKVQERLSLAGFEMFSAYDGRHGLQIAKVQIPDLIITDTMIPLMNGYELCKAIRLDEDTKSIPIVVLTEKRQMEESFLSLGVKDFIKKPFSMDELETVVKNKLHLTDVLQLQRSKILVNGRPEILSCCQELLKGDSNWTGYFSHNKESFLQDAIKYVPDVIFMDLLMPGTAIGEIILKLRLIPELRNTTILTYYANASTSRDPIAIRAQMIEVQYLKIVTEDAGAKEYLGPFNPLTFLNLINIYRKDFGG